MLSQTNTKLLSQKHTHKKFTVLNENLRIKRLYIPRIMTMGMVRGVNHCDGHTNQAWQFHWC